MVSLILSTYASRTSSLIAFSLFALGIFLLYKSLCTNILTRSLPLPIENDFACDVGPYLYVTVHDEIHNVMKYSRNGCLLESNVLSGGPLYRAELRGVRIGTYFQERNALYVADASTGQSQILVYGECNAHGVRPFRGTVVTTKLNSGADHSYGLTFDQDENVYASFQHTDVVLRFYKDSFRPMPLPSTINYKQGSYFEGTFFQYGRPGEHSDSEQGVRGIAVVDKFMWIANEDTDSVTVVDMQGRPVYRVEIDCPVGVFHDVYFGLVFIGSKNKYGAVYGVNAYTYKIEKVYYVDGMEHPTGIVSHGNVLYVVDQGLGKILTFDISTQKFVAVILSKSPGKLEQLEISQC